MKVTQKMIDAAYAASRCDQAKCDECPAACEECIAAMLKAALKVIDPVPEEIKTVIDSDGDEWTRNPVDPTVWIYNGEYFRTYPAMEAMFGPITWKGKDK